MELTTAQQTEAFLFAFLLGLITGVLYIVFMLLRDFFVRSFAAGFAADVVFMLTASLLNFLFAVGFTLGRIRFYVVFAEAVSFFVVYFTAGRFIRLIFRKISHMTAHFFSWFTGLMSHFIQSSAVFLKVAHKNKNEL